MNKQEADNYQEQMMIDKFYFKNGDCCAGCDHWRHDGSIVGECTLSKILPASERASLLHFKGVSMNMGAGHALTRRDYVCGNFKDDFDWGSLPILYLKRIGYRK